MLNLTFEWMLLLLLRPFYDRHVQRYPLMTTSPDGGLVSEERPPRPRRYEELRKLVKLANEECPKSATRVLDLLRAYDKLFTLRLCPVTNVQIAYLAGKTHLLTVIAGESGGKKVVANGLKARDKVRECVKHLRAIGETWASGTVTADLLEKELEGEIEKQSKLTTPEFEQSPPSQEDETKKDCGLEASSTIANAPPRSVQQLTPSKTIPIVSPRFVPPAEYLGASNAMASRVGAIGGALESPNRKRQGSPSFVPPPKRLMQQRLQRPKSDSTRVGPRPSHCELPSANYSILDS